MCNAEPRNQLYLCWTRPYAGLKGLCLDLHDCVTRTRILPVRKIVTVGVLQQLQLANIPVFQFAMYSSGDMEISCGQPFDITGRVHSNGYLYVEPDNS